MSEVTHDQARLMLQLYEMRREPRLRQARDWFIRSFAASTMEELAKKYPAGTEENTNFRMVTSYWDMACGMLNRGLMDDELFFENNTEFWLVWQKIKAATASGRAATKNTRLYKHMEDAAARIEAFWERTSPGFLEMQRKRIAQLFEQLATAAK